MPEVLEKRTRSSKTHSLGGRKFAWDGTIGSVHYEDNGWQEIDNIFEPALAPWDWEMLKAGYHIKVKEDFTAGQIIEFEKQGETVQFQPMALEWTNDLDQIQQVSMPQNVTPVITNPEVDLLPAVGVPSHQGTILWNDAYGQGIDFQWRCTSTRLQKILEIENLNKLPVPQQYILDGGNPALRLNLIFAPSRDVAIYIDGELWNKRVKKQSFNIIEFRKDGEVLWGFMPLRYWGSGTDPETNQGQSVATLEKRGNKLYISIRVPYDWLQTATFPVFIDIDIDEQVSAGADDGYFRPSCTEYSNSSSTMYHGYGAIQYGVWARFPNISGLSGATVIAAYCEFRVAFNNVGVKADIRAEDSASPTAPSDCNDANTRTRTAAKVDWNHTSLSTDIFQQTDSIVSVIQELATDYNPTAILIFLDCDDADSGSMGWRTYNYFAPYAPKLHIEYTTGVDFTQVVGSGAISIASTLNLKSMIDVGAGSVAITGALTSILTFFQAVGSGVITIAGALSSVLTFFKTVGGGSITISGTLNRLIKIGVGAGSIVIAGALGLKTFISVGSGAVTSAATLGRKTIIAVGAGSITIVGTLATVLTSIISQAVGGGSIAISGALGLLTKITAGNGAIAIAGALASVLTFFQAVGSGAVAIAGALSSILKFTQTVGGGAVSIAGTLGRLIKLGVGSGSIAISGTLASVLTFFQTVGSGSVTIAGTLGRLIKISVGSGSIAIVGILSSVLTFFQAVGSGSVAITGALGRLIKLTVGSGSIAIAGTLGRLIKLAVGGGAISSAGSLATSLISVITQAVGGGAVAISGTLGRLIKITAGNGAIAIAGALNLKIKLNVGDGAVAIASTLIQISEWIKLTLLSRLFGFTLKSKSVSLSLQSRSLALTLQPRSLDFTLQSRSLDLTLKER